MRVRAGVMRLAIGVVFAVILYLLPLALAASPYVLFALTLTLCYAIPAMALNLLLGYTGLVSLGHMGFAGIGAYVTAVLMKNGVAPFAPAIVAAPSLPGLSAPWSASPAFAFAATSLSSSRLPSA